MRGRLGYLQMQLYAEGGGIKLGGGFKERRLRGKNVGEEKRVSGNTPTHPWLLDV